MPKIGDNAPITETKTQHEEERLTGALTCSLIFGGLIIVSWIAAFIYHLSL